MMVNDGNGWCVAEPVGGVCVEAGRSILLIAPNEPLPVWVTVKYVRQTHKYTVIDLRIAAPILKYNQVDILPFNDQLMAISMYGTRKVATEFSREHQAADFNVEQRHLLIIAFLLLHFHSTNVKLLGAVFLFRPL